jgi:hypothetical protein
MKNICAGMERGLPPGIDMTRRVACPQPPNPSPIRRKTLGRPGSRVFFFVEHTFPGRSAPLFGGALQNRDRSKRLSLERSRLKAGTSTVIPSLPAHHQMVPVHHLGAAPEAEDQENIGR